MNKNDQRLARFLPLYTYVHTFVQRETTLLRAVCAYIVVLLVEEPHAKLSRGFFVGSAGSRVLLWTSACAIESPDNSVFSGGRQLRFAKHQGTSTRRFLAFKSHCIATIPTNARNVCSAKGATVSRWFEVLTYASQTVPPRLPVLHPFSLVSIC